MGNTDFFFIHICSQMQIVQSLLTANAKHSEVDEIYFRERRRYHEQKLLCNKTSREKHKKEG